MKPLKRFLVVMALVILTTGCLPWISRVSGPWQVVPEETYELQLSYSLLYKARFGPPFSLNLYIEAREGIITVPEPLSPPYLSVAGSGTSNVRISIKNDFEGTLGNIFFTPSVSDNPYYMVNFFLIGDSITLSSDYLFFAVKVAPTVVTADVTLRENQPPVNSVPSALTVRADSSLPIALDVSDPDIGEGFYDVRLTASLGTLATVAAAGAGDIVEGIGTNQLYIKSTQARIGTYLSQVVYTPSVSGPATDTLTMLTNDRGNNGSGGQKTDTDTVIITIEVAPPPPVPLLPSDNNTGASGGLLFSGGTINCVLTATCAGSVSASGGTPPYAYEWVGGNIPEAFRTISPEGAYAFEFSEEQAGSYSWSIQATDGTGAKATATFTVVVAP